MLCKASRSTPNLNALLFYGPTAEEAQALAVWTTFTLEADKIVEMRQKKLVQGNGKKNVPQNRAIYNDAVICVALSHKFPIEACGCNVRKSEKTQRPCEFMRGESKGKKISMFCSCFGFLCGL